ncbi:alpha-ribazole phosphatase [Pseudobutyrivibrio sp. YE44]|uniref:histidine phosphatase family protein n=1 Tax=Pseudobutyrivibrio sp. YE44 TaxID=1520802 RepID=UPI000891EE37|nr:histidine phosphatase family protein [Pseudobutyrivibrio sp. YE44]SDB06020.1 alpha-ribazole phosphatase [Pseudobutyrivibrio sp. YE44]
MERRITLIRHGCCPGNDRKCYIGITDEPLSEKGEKSILLRAYPEADIVFSSPLQRCVFTAKLIYPNLTPVIIDDLRETDFGLFEGKNYQDLEGNPDYQRFIDCGGTIPFPQGESRDEATVRAIKGFEELLTKIGEAKNISVIVHGGTIMAILSHYFGGDYYSYHVENSEGYTFDLSHDGIFGRLHSRSFLR